MTLEALRTLNVEFVAQLHAVNQMSLSDWAALAMSLEVAMNDREHAAKKLAIRKLKNEGKI